MFGNFLFSKFLGNSIDEITDGKGFEPLLFHIQGIFAVSALFQRASAARFWKKRRKIFHKVMGAGLLVFTNQVQCPFRLPKNQIGRRDWRLKMSEENAPQKERFLREVEQQLLRKDLDAKLLEDGLLHVQCNERPLCSVDGNGTVRFRPADITGAEVDRQLRTVTQTISQKHRRNPAKRLRR